MSGSRVWVRDGVSLQKKQVFQFGARPIFIKTFAKTRPSSGLPSCISSSHLNSSNIFLKHGARDNFCHHALGKCLRNWHTRIVSFAVGLPLSGFGALVGSCWKDFFVQHEIELFNFLITTRRKRDLESQKTWHAEFREGNRLSSHFRIWKKGERSSWETSRSLERSKMLFVYPFVTRCQRHLKRTRVRNKLSLSRREFA